MDAPIRRIRQFIRIDRQKIVDSALDPALASTIGKKRDGPFRTRWHWCVTIASELAREWPFAMTAGPDVRFVPRKRHARCFDDVASGGDDRLDLRHQLGIS